MRNQKALGNFARISESEGELLDEIEFQDIIHHVKCRSLIPAATEILVRSVDIHSTYLRDTLLVLPSEKSRPCDSAGVFSLKEERFGFTVLESEDLAIAANIELTL